MFYKRQIYYNTPAIIGLSSCKQKNTLEQSCLKKPIETALIQQGQNLRLPILSQKVPPLL
jgi:hypothetical protein